MSYWTVLARRAVKEAARDTKLDTLPGIAFSLGGQVVTAIVLYSVAGQLLGNNLWTRVASAVAPFLLFPLFLLFRLVTTPAKIDAERVDAIRAQDAKFAELANEIADLNARFKSDIQLQMSITKTVQNYPELGREMLESILVENTGPVVLENCVVKTGAKNRMNWDYYNSSNLGDACEPFSLRPGEMRNVPIIAFPMKGHSFTHDPDCSYAFLERHPVTGETRGAREVLDSGFLYAIHIEVLSSNTYPAKMVLRLDEDDWSLTEISDANIFE